MGWSEAKIARALGDQQRAAERATEDRNCPDSLELWATILTDLGAELGLSHAGLIVHFYGGAIEPEEFEAKRRVMKRDVPLPEALGLLAEDEVTIFSLE